MKKLLFIILILIIVLGAVLWLVWHFWLEDFIERERKLIIITEWQLQGYEMSAINVSEKETSLSYKPVEHKDKDIQRVVGNVTVRIKTYPIPEEAQKQIEDARLLYVWEWRKEKISNRKFEVNTGFLFSPTERRYKEAYLAWIENETTYYELIARPADIRDFSDKDYLHQSAKEVAETILLEH